MKQNIITVSKKHSLETITTFELNIFVKIYKVLFCFQNIYL